MSSVTIIRSLLREPTNILSDARNLPMTFQLGMVGSNGILIASDTRATHFPAFRPNQLWSCGTHGTNSPKITINYGRGIAVSAAREMETAARIAKEIADHLPDGQFENPISWIEDAGNRILCDVRTERNNPDERIEAHCLIAIRRSTPKLFHFTLANIDGRWGGYCKKQERIAVAGDNVNGAIYWPEAYYNSFPYAARRIPVKTLIPLAAHTLVVAHRLNPVTISGLEVVFCDEIGFHRLSGESLQALRDAATIWDQQFRDTILGYVHEFTYEPEEIG